MGLQDPKTNFKMVACIDPVALAGAAATVDGASVDTKGFRWATFIVQAGVKATTITGLSALIMSDPVTGGAFATAISGAVFDPVALLDGADEQIGRIDCHKLDATTSRWLRIEVTSVGAAPTTPISAVCILSNSEDDTKYQTVSFAFGV